MKSNEKVMTAEDILDRIPTLDSPVGSADEESEVPVNILQNVPRGKPKSGRIWKEERKRFSSIIKTRGIRRSFDEKRKLKEDLSRVREMSKAIKTRKREEKEMKKQRRIDNLKRAEENQKKGEVVQVITNTAKIKRMKKKQLRMIQKRDTTKK